jgi:hypothetical protein
MSKLSSYMLGTTPSTLCLAILLSALSTHSTANELMSKAQYADYSVLYQCAEISFHDDLNKKEAELIRIEDKYGLTDDNFDDFDDLVTSYERDDNLLDTIRDRVSKECIKRS